jgi:uncharacterized membrane protein YfcA
VIALAILFGLAIGLVVGTVGGGGAILALPILVYVLNEGVGQASSASLIVVALAAGLGGGALARDGHVCWRIALSFSAPAAAGSVLGTLGNTAVSARALILAFVPIMLVAAAATWRRAGSPAGDAGDECPDVRLSAVVLSGLAVGVLTGFFGVGGGFLIVPALTIALGVPMRRAIATSLVIITLTALAALASHVAAGAELDVPVTVALASATGVGAIAGTRLGQRLPQAVLGRGFALVVTGIAAFLLVDVLVLGGPPTG